MSVEPIASCVRIRRVAPDVRMGSSNRRLSKLIVSTFWKTSAVPATATARPVS